MPDRTILFGEDATDAVYQLGDDDTAGGGNFILVRDTDGSVTILQYNPTSGDLEAAAPLDLGDNALASVASLNGADIAAAASGETFVSNGDGTLSFGAAGTIDVYADADALPDPTTLSEPTIAYLEAEDDYVAPFNA